MQLIRKQYEKRVSYKFTQERDVKQRLELIYERAKKYQGKEPDRE